MPGTPTCGCGHGLDVHLHYRAGRDCGICGLAGCSHFVKAPTHSGRPVIGAFVALLAAGRAAAAHVTPGGGPSPRRR